AIAASRMSPATPTSSNAFQPRAAIVRLIDRPPNGATIRGSGLPSMTVTLRPCRARYIAATSPTGPAPTIVTSPVWCTDTTTISRSPSVELAFAARRVAMSDTRSCRLVAMSREILSLGVYVRAPLEVARHYSRRLAMRPLAARTANGSPRVIVMASSDEPPWCALVDRNHDDPGPGLRSIVCATDSFDADCRWIEERGLVASRELVVV